MSKRSYLILDLVRSERFGLNPTESILASALYGLLAQYSIQYSGRPYYMADYSFVAKYCPILPVKADTLRRMYKRLETLGLIETLRIDKHIYFTPSQDLRDWGLVCESATTEKNPQQRKKIRTEAENNPKNAEKNPSIPYISNRILLESNIIKENSVKESFEASLSTPIADNSENENNEAPDTDDLFEALNRVLDQPTTLKDPKTEKEKSSAKKENKAIPASVEEVAAYCREKGFTISAEAFFSYHSASGWMIGKNKMKDWKAAVRYWAANESKTKKQNYYDRRNNDIETPVIATSADDYRETFAEAIRKKHLGLS